MRLGTGNTENKRKAETSSSLKRMSVSVDYAKGETSLVPTLMKDNGIPTPSFKGAVWVENIPYKIDTLLYVGTAKAMKSYIKRNFHQKIDESAVSLSSVDGLTVECERGDGSRFIMIWMPRFHWNAQNIGVLVHEIIHATVMVLKMSGVHSVILEGDSEDSDDEALTHTADHMTEALLEKMMRKSTS